MRICLHHRVVLLALLPALLLLSAACFGGGDRVQLVPGGDSERGRVLMRAYGCHTCHLIPGVLGANSLVGPPLTAWAERQFIAGALPNQPNELIAWLQDPQAIEPQTAMPNLGATEQEARDMSAYLYTLRSN
jgi:cytochrome c